MVFGMSFSRGIWGLALTFWTSGSIDMRSEQSLRAAVRNDTTNLKAQLSLVEWHLTWNEVDKAMVTLREALENDPGHAWRYHEWMGDVLLEKQKDLEAAEIAYEAALNSKPRARYALIQYGMLLIWRGARKEAEKLFNKAVDENVLRNAMQRPFDFREDLPANDGPWLESSSYSLLSRATDNLAEIRLAAGKEYRKWSSTRPQDAEEARDMAIDPQGQGKRMQFWIHRPRFERGHWRDACSYKTPETCKSLRAINASGLIVLRASFEVFEAGYVLRPRCHATNRELYIDTAIVTPSAAVKHRFASTTAGGKVHKWVNGDIRVLDPSYEHFEENTAGDPAVILRLVVRHPLMPCEGGFLQCGFSGLVRHAYRRVFGPPRRKYQSWDESDEL